MTDAQRSMLNRRQILQRIAVGFGGVLSISITKAVLADEAGAVLSAGQAGKSLSTGEVAFIDRVAELIIPTTDTPGAHDAGVVGFIDRLITTYETAEGRSAFLTGLNEFQTKADQETGGDFLTVTRARQEAFLEEVDAAAFAVGAEKGFYRSLKEMVVTGYYTSEIGASEELVYLAVPGPFEGETPVTDETRAWAAFFRVG